MLWHPVQAFLGPLLPVLVLWAPGHRQSLLTTPLGSRRLPLSCLGLERRAKESDKGGHCYWCCPSGGAAASALLGLSLCPPASPASPSPLPASQLVPSPPVPSGGGPVAEWASGAGRARAAPAAALVAMGPPPGEEGGGAMWARAQVSPSSPPACRVQVQVQGWGWPGASPTALGEITDASSNPCSKPRLEFGLTFEEPLSRRGRREGRCPFKLWLRGKEPRGSPPSRPALSPSASGLAPVPQSRWALHPETGKMSSATPAAPTDTHSARGVGVRYSEGPEAHWPKTG